MKSVSFLTSTLGNPIPYVEIFEEEAILAVFQLPSQLDSPQYGEQAWPQEQERVQDVRGRTDPLQVI